MQVPVQLKEYVSDQFRCGLKLKLNYGRRKNYLENERSKRNTILRLPGFQTGKKIVRMAAVLALTRLHDNYFKERLTINLNTTATKLPLYVFRMKYCRPNMRIVAWFLFCWICCLLSTRWITAVFLRRLSSHFGFGGKVLAWFKSYLEIAPNLFRLTTLLLRLWYSPRIYSGSASELIREFKINDATAATTPQNLHT